MQQVTGKRDRGSSGYVPDLAFVLIHGSGLGGWIWRRVAPLLDWPTLAVDLPGPEWAGDLKRSTLAACAQTIAAEVEARGLRRVILLAHSFGGVVAPKVAARLADRVQHIVFLAATIPPEGRCVLDTFPLTDRWLTRAALQLEALGFPSARDAAGRVLRRALAHGPDGGALDLLLDRFGPAGESALLLERVSRADMPDVACTYVKLPPAGGSLSLAQQERMARNLWPPGTLAPDGEQIRVATGPQEFAHLLNRIAADVPRARV